MTPFTPQTPKPQDANSSASGFISKVVVLAFIAISMPVMLKAQPGNILNRARQTVISKTNSRIDQHIDEQVDKTLDELEGKKDQSMPSNTVANNPTQLASTGAPVVATGMSSYKKFDFKPGDNVIYANDFSGESLGESPIGWNSTGTAAVVTIDGLEGQWVELARDAFYMSDNTAAFGENFTVEFDLLMRRENPKSIFSQLGFGLMNSFVDTITHYKPINNYKQVFAAEVKVQPVDYNGSHLHFESFINNGHYLETEVRKYPQMQEFFNKPMHVSMQIQSERLRVWFNQDKVYDLPHAIDPTAKLNQLFFFMKGNGSPGDDPVYDITNIKIAMGIADTRHKLLDEGKFSTTGILFALNSTEIMPQSYPVLKKIAELLAANPAVRIKINGHTDNTGSEVTNLELSKKRAAAVKEFLQTEFDIAPERMETDGMGEAKPVGDNASPAGRAKNRRVEFIKI